LIVLNFILYQPCCRVIGWCSWRACREKIALIWVSIWENRFLHQVTCHNYLNYWFINQFICKETWSVGRGSQSKEEPGVRKNFSLSILNFLIQFRELAQRFTFENLNKLIEIKSRKFLWFALKTSHTEDKFRKKYLFSVKKYQHSQGHFHLISRKVWTTLMNWNFKEFGNHWRLYTMGFSVFFFLNYWRLDKCKKGRKWWNILWKIVKILALIKSLDFKTLEKDQVTQKWDVQRSNH
jgi:hypothetical protein